MLKTFQAFVLRETPAMKKQTVVFCVVHAMALKAMRSAAVCLFIVSHSASIISLCHSTMHSGSDRHTEHRAYLVTSDTNECTLIHITLEQWGIPQSKVICHGYVIHGMGISLQETLICTC